MEIVLILVPASLLLGLVAILGFIWAVKRGQLDDMQTPAMRIFDDEQCVRKPSKGGTVRNSSTSVLERNTQE
jgi:cbb3-type cytochrome oxidase maturation protein